MAATSECQNCGRRWRDEDLRTPERIFERVAPREPMPSGECPECGALCHPVDHQCDCDDLVPGALYNWATNGDDSRDWIESCDDCRVFATDDDAAVAVVKALGGTLGWDVPEGLHELHPYRIQPDRRGS